MYLVLLQVWCTQFDSCWGGQPGRNRHMGHTWTPTAERQTTAFRSWIPNTDDEVKWFSSLTEHTSRGGSIGPLAKTPVKTSRSTSALITHRVSPGLEQSQFPSSEKEMNTNETFMESCKGRKNRQEWRESTYIDSSSLLAHRWTVEPSLSCTTMRFSLGLLSGGVTPTVQPSYKSFTQSFLFAYFISTYIIQCNIYRYI